MSDYQQKIRDIIFQAVEREIPIYEAASIIEKIVRTEIDGE
jgi:type III secretion system FlhB-like substrate exporter